MTDEQSVSDDGTPVALSTYRDLINSCPDVPGEFKGFALFLAWKSKQSPTDQGEVCTVPSVPRQLAKEFGVGETKVKTLINALVANKWLRRHGRGSLILTIPPLHTDPSLQIERHYQWVTASRMVIPWAKGSISEKRAANKIRSLERLNEGRPLRPLESPPPTLKVAPSASLKSPPPPFVKSPPPPSEVAPSALEGVRSYMPTPEGQSLEPSPEPPAVPPFGRQLVPGSSGPRPGPLVEVADEVDGEPQRADEGQQPQDAHARGARPATPPQPLGVDEMAPTLPEPRRWFSDDEWESLPTSRDALPVM